MYDIMNFKNEGKALNDLTFTDYYYRLTLIATSIFKWENLPNGINERWIERFLYYHGECMFFKDETFGLMVSKTTRNGVNHYDEPIDLVPVATNFSNIRSYKNGVEAVLIKNNDLSIPTELTTRLYAYRLADITRSQDININAQRTPVLIKCTDKQRLTLRNVYQQYSGNEPVIYGDKSTDFSSVEVLKTEAPVVFDKLQTHKHQLMNEFLTFLGINNANQDKKERLVADEVQANNEQVVVDFNKMLKARESACEEINKLFGTNIKVSKRSDIYIEYIAQVLNGEYKYYSEGSETPKTGSEEAK